MDELNAVLGEWEGYAVFNCWRTRACADTGTREAVWIELNRRTDVPFRCPGCGQTLDRYHDYDERAVRDLPILGVDTMLLVGRFRVACPTCGPKVEELSWLSKHARVTPRFADAVARLCAELPVKHVAAHFGLKWDAVKAIHKAHLQRTLGEPDLSDVEVLVMDEFALRKGHRYATVILEPNRREILWVGHGRRQEDIRPFFEKLGPERCARIRAVAMDMNAAYEAEVKAQCPNAVIVYDRFHVLAKYGQEVINPVRTAEARRQTSRRERKVIKGSRWLLLRNASGLKRQDRVKLRELLHVNRRLAVVHMLKEDLRSLWDYQLPSWATQFFKEWVSRAMHSRIEPLKRFARNLRTRFHGLISHCVYPLHTSLLEGINNKIKVIKRAAYGYRDDDYFFLKIRAAFPGNPG